LIKSAIIRVGQRRLFIDTTNAELIAIDEQQKLLKVQDRTIYIAWNKYANCWEAELFAEKQNQYGEFVNEFITGVTGNSESDVISKAIKLELNT
tara:strand:- start:653 stop:934 length:282 start_codon:yes stop_codon:yes gene_type:complete